MSVSNTDWHYFQSASMPNPVSAPTAPAGGAMSSVEITDGSEDLWLQPNIAQASGIPDASGVSFQYQCGYVANSNSTSGAVNVGIYIGNTLILPTTPGLVSLTPTSSLDTGISAVCAEVLNSGSSASLVTETLALTGATQVSGVQTATRAERVTLINPTTGALVQANGAIAIMVGSQQVGVIPAGYSVATYEVSVAAAAALGDVGTWANCQTDPSAGALTYTHPNSVATRVTLGNSGTMAASTHAAVYLYQRLNAGMAPLATEDLQIVTYYEAS